MVRSSFAARVGYAILAVFAAADLAHAEIVAIVCPLELRTCFSDWVVHRAAEGRRFAFVDPIGCESQLTRLRMTAEQAGDEPVTVVLVGDGVRTGIRPKTVQARVIDQYGPETDLVTDHPYADVAGAAQIGRLPFNDMATLSDYLQRVVQRDSTPVTWSDARLQIAAGVGGFSPLIDAAIEGAATSVVRRLASPAHAIDLTRYDGQRRASNLNAMQPRGGVWVWMGHGLRDRLPGIEPRGVTLAARGADVAVLLACYSGDFSQANDCVAEQLLRGERGPLAVVASTRVSMPYGNARFGAELLSGYAKASRATTIGELVAGARNRSTDKTTEPALAGLASLARLMGPAGHSLQDERRDHADMYQLLGDPLMPISRFLPMEIDVPSRLSGDQGLTIRGVAPIEGRLRVQVTWPAGMAVDQPTSDAPIRAGDHFAVQVPIDDAWRRGERVVRVGIESDHQLALAAAIVTRSHGESARVAMEERAERTR